MSGRPRKAKLKHKWSRNVYGLGNTHRSGNGYLMRVVGKDHPLADSRGRVYEHILVVEKAIGRHLKRGNVVHHVNENKADNSHSNLVVCEHQAYHFLLHERQRAYKQTGNPNSQHCSYCPQWVVPNLPDSYIYQAKPSKGHKTYGGITAWHRSCRKLYDQQYHKRRKCGTN